MQIHIFLGVHGLKTHTIASHKVERQYLKLSWSGEILRVEPVSSWGVDLSIEKEPAKRKS